ncbi:hypothetical protein GS597_15425 [Synechococcales cyanobacterium C]|uniref:Uncharacterized protein n=1 Tax=Petrachloros mirabilis ULC683 TaxID=2781853 RepID=A0A8K2A142_9CYAN|nr:hypothetical protein [Petrachloros mirabilis]NCJ07872.1 hypothetical protein [Petrachloros mirabilis ULC683]
MNPFDPIPPPWTASATHAIEFCCPQCQTPCTAAEQVWINRRAPVLAENHRRKWQEFYHCPCGQAWWAWSSDRPSSLLRRDDVSSRENQP